MRADNCHHITAAARKRAAAIRKRAIVALRRMDNAGRPVTFDALAGERGSPGPGSTTSPIYGRRSNVSAPAETGLLRDRHLFH